MAKDIASFFFFGQKVLKDESEFANAVGRLYLGIKEDEASNLVQDDEVKIFGKELASQILVDIVGCSFFELLEKNMILLRRHLMAYHAKKAYQLKVDEKRAWINEQRK